MLSDLKKHMTNDVYKNFNFQVGAHPSLFGDNCRLTYKYLEAEYQCRGNIM